jgi:hypothetical protein
MSKRKAQVKKTISEVFDDFKNANTRDEKIHILRSNYTFSLKYILQGTFHPNIEFVFESIPPYKKSEIPDGMGYTTIDQELGRAYIFERNNPKVSPDLSQKRKTELLIQVLEALEDREASVFVQMILKKQLIPGLTYDLVKEAFPELLPDFNPGTKVDILPTKEELPEDDKNFIRIIGNTPISKIFN